MAFETKVVRSRRRSVSLEVKDDATLIVRAPHFVPQSFLADLIAKKQLWIEKRREQALKKQEFQRQIDVNACLKTARELIPQRAAFYSNLTGIRYSKIKISRAKRRWGSCSSSGSLNFSWRLALAPLEVIDYVVVHELAHLVHPNHSKRFWALVGKIYPRFKPARKWLKESGRLL